MSFEEKKQQLTNLPEEILAQPRFFSLYGKEKGDTPKGWNKPEKQKLFSELEGVLGFDTCGHGRAADYLFFDFDHVLDDNGEFVNNNAHRWYNFIIGAFEDCYCERSISGHGIHILALPTTGKFGRIVNNEGQGVLLFDPDNPNVKLEIFYKQSSRYCLVTGNLFQTTSKTIPSGEIVDDVLSTILRTIKDSTPKNGISPKKTAGRTHEEKKFTSELQELVDKINSISLEELESRDYLRHSEKGAPSPDGFICPWCGSGNHKHKTGGLTFYTESNNNHVHCHARDCHGDIIDLVAQKRGYDIQGKNFYSTLKKIADEFAIPYDKKIFEYQPKQHNATDTMKEIPHDFTPQAEPREESESKDRFTRDFIEDCPINLRLPNFFSFREWGITQIIPPKKEKDETKYICVSRTPIVPTKKFREPIKGTVEYEFAFLSDGKWRTVEVDGATLGDTRTMKKFLRYHDVLIEDAVKLSSFFNALIALNSPDMPKIKSYNQTGWTNDDCEEFAYPSANSTAVIRRVGYDYDKIFKPRGDKEAWKEKFLEVTKQGSAQAHVIIGAACAAPLIKPLEDLPNLQVHVWGKKSIGKTPMLKFAVSIFGNTDVDKLTHTFAATPKSRLETACAFNDLPLICEELESIGAKDAEKLSTDIYNFFLGIGGQALKRDGTKRAAKLFNSTRLTCGEHSLVQSYGNGGEFKRVLDLRCARLLNEDFASDLYGFCKRNYGLFGEQWIQYIIDNRDEISKNYHILLDAVKDGQRKRGNENDLTQLRTLVISAVAYQHFKACIGLQDCLNLVDCANDLDEIIETLPTVDEIDDTTRAIEALRSWVAAHDKSFIRDMKTDTGTTEEISSYTPYSCGKISNNGEVLFYPTELKKILEDELHFTSAAKLISEWKDRGDVLITDAGRTTHQTRVKKKRTRVIHFRPNVISSDEDSDEAEYYETLGQEEK